MQVNKDEVAAVFVDLGYSWVVGWDAAELTKKLNGRGGIASCRKKGHLFTDPKAEALFKAIDDAQEAGTLVRVVDAPAPKPAKAFRGKRILKAAEVAVKSPVKVETKSTPAPQQKPAKAKPAPQPAKGKPGRPSRDALPVPRENVVYQANGRPVLGSPMWAFREYFAKHPLKVSDRGPGVMRAVIDELKKAGKAGPGGTPAPLTKDELLAALAKRFGDRPAEKLRTNMNNLVPSRLRDEYRIHVWVTPPGTGPRGYYIVGDGSKPQPKSATAGGKHAAAR